MPLVDTQQNAFNKAACCSYFWLLREQDAEAVLELLVQRGESHKALAVLRQPNLSRELIYKFAPALMAAAPADTVSLPGCQCCTLATSMSKTPNS